MNVFYDPDNFPNVNKIVTNKKLIVDELNDNIEKDVFMGFRSDFYDTKTEKVQGSWTATQVFYNRTRKGKAVPPVWESREAKKTWLRTLKAAPDRYPKTYEILNQCPCVYWAGMSCIGGNSSISPHKHTYNTPTLILQICMEMGTGTGSCDLIAGGETMNWNHKYQVNIFDGRCEHELINTMDCSRYIFHVEFDPGYAI